MAPLDFGIVLMLISEYSVDICSEWWREEPPLQENYAICIKAVSDSEQSSKRVFKVYAQRFFTSYFFITK